MLDNASGQQVDTFNVGTLHYETDTNIISVSLDNSFMWKSFFNDPKHVSYHIFNKTDTVEFSLIKDTIIIIDGIKIRSKINNGNYECESGCALLEKEHDYCQVLKNGQPFTGEFSRRLVSEDSTVEVFKGNLVQGYIQDGSFVKFFSNGKIQMTGQFMNNWKIGIWNTFYDNGNIKGVFKYIVGTDYPVVEFGYTKSGELEGFRDEESKISKLIEDNKE